MEAHNQDDRDELSRIEARLAGWRPDSEGLNADALLFAAGRATAGRRRIYWPAVCAVLLALAASFGIWGLDERRERLMLVRKIEESSTTPSPPAPAIVPAVEEPAYAPTPDGYFSLRQMMEKDPDRVLATPPSNTHFDGPLPPGPTILTVRSGDLLIDP